jgi:hypothetical protein
MRPDSIGAGEKFQAWMLKHNASFLNSIQPNAPIQNRWNAVIHSAKTDVALVAVSIAVPLENLILSVANIVGKPIGLIASFFSWKTCETCSLLDAWECLHQCLVMSSVAVVRTALLVPHLIVHTLYNTVYPLQRLPTESQSEKISLSIYVPPRTGFVETTLFVPKAQKNDVINYVKTVWKLGLDDQGLYDHRHDSKSNPTERSPSKAGASPAPSTPAPAPAAAPAADGKAAT